MQVDLKAKVKRRESNGCLDEGETQIHLLKL